MFSPSLSKEEIKRRQAILISLPQDLKQSVVSFETADKLYNISWGKYKLGPKQQRIISFTTGEILLGIIKLNEFANILQERLKIDKAKTEAIAQEINKEIFQPVIRSLSKVQKESFGETDLKSAAQKSEPKAVPKDINPNVVDLKNQ